MFVAGFIYFLPVVVLGAILVVPVALSAQTDAERPDAALLAGGMCLFWVVAADRTASPSRSCSTQHS